MNETSEPRSLSGVEGFVTFLSKKVRENAISDCINENTRVESHKIVFLF